ncbi:MAG: HRDC domain-containing protein [Oscillospiraceae bacterium]|nr:HRDC domain-containing protein [Oscillospiraceae bacterium]
MIFSNASLEDMCIRLPETSEEFLQVSGVGEKKLEHYGSYFMEEISDYLREKSS